MQLWASVWLESLDVASTGRFLVGPAGLLRPFSPAAVALGPQSGDLALHHVTGPQEPAMVGAVARGTAGHEQVAGAQLGDRRGVFDEPGDVEDHVAGRTVLHHLTVEPQPHSQRGGVDKCGRYEEGAGGGEGGSVLAGDVQRAGQGSLDARARLITVLDVLGAPGAGKVVLGRGGELIVNIYRLVGAQSWTWRRAPPNVEGESNR
jgi:hypothetical protein